MLKIAVEKRASTVVGHDHSLSVFLRLVRPLRKLSQRGGVEVCAASTAALLDHGGFPYDVLFVNRPTQSENLTLIRRARDAGVPVVVDIDDWMYTLPSYGKDLLRERADPARELYDLAQAMTLPTSFFAQVMAPVFAGQRSVLPYGFEFDGAASTSVAEADTRRIILSSMFTLKLGRRTEAFAAALRDFLDRFEDWSVDFYCENYATDLFEHPRIARLSPVSYDDYLRVLSQRRYAFCLVPLAGYEEEADLLFNACKSPLKFVDYSANAIGGIYSRSPVYETVIEDRRSGLLVDNTYDGWFAAMGELAQNASLRRELSTVSHDVAREHFSLDVSVEALRRTLDTLLP
ncbi:hypothetical protein [Aurantimonas sp. Leaf443]|uniref:hypothetical protein n=1 Tax=Aurantimonas sp. Leaf443 TaxID=1736378 RepID=UPI0006F76010|nr:hypothetical protein [Aurantimonas sp. Leaf443]KQT85137.1 hypothetical protein ASG48_07615 [Aurantimonas sp. Leaf443]